MEDQYRNLAVRWRWLSQEVCYIKESALFKLARTEVLSMLPSAISKVQQAKDIIYEVELSLKDMPSWICTERPQSPSESCTVERDSMEEELFSIWDQPIDFTEVEELLHHCRLVEGRMQMLRLCMSPRERIAILAPADFRYCFYFGSTMGVYRISRD